MILVCGAADFGLQRVTSCAGLRATSSQRLGASVKSFILGKDWKNG
jgi:hypothetical protein